MRICMIAEGCYPYSVGGVSGWIHSMIRAFPRVDFSILAILPGRGMSGRFAYELPVFNSTDAPNRSRTDGLTLRRRSLYPTELPGHIQFEADQAYARAVV